MPVIRVSDPVKRRLDEMQQVMAEALDRQVTISEVIEALLRDSDQEIADLRIGQLNREMEST